MRIWSLHPKYLDPIGLVALWREGLLAQAVLSGKTKGYTKHSQLVRFQAQPLPLGSIAQYLRIVHSESVARGYHFDGRKINHSRASDLLDVTRGQLQYEWCHLLEKLKTRNPRWRASLEAVKRPQQHPLFCVHPGVKAEWEKGELPNPYKASPRQAQK